MTDTVQAAALVRARESCIRAVEAAHGLAFGILARAIESPHELVALVDGSRQEEAEWFAAAVDDIPTLVRDARQSFDSVASAIRPHAVGRCAHVEAIEAAESFALSLDAAAFYDPSGRTENGAVKHVATAVVWSLNLLRRGMPCVQEAWQRTKALDVRALVDRIRNESARAMEAESVDDQQYIDLDDLAAIVRHHKRTLERLKARKVNPFPSPDREGGGGKADYWIWSKVRPWLEQEYGMTLPTTYPDIRIRRG